MTGNIDFYMNRALIHITLLIFFFSISTCILSSCATKEEPQAEIFNDIDREIAGADTLSSGEKSRNELFYDMKELPSEEFDPRVSRDRQIAIIPMEEENGVYYIMVEINGMKLRCVFDTGASSVSISSAEAFVLYKQGSLTIDDYVAETKLSIANGDIIPGTKVLLKNVNIGGIDLYDVQAVIIDEPQAPLLVGQSVFKRFKSISIDNIKNDIILEY